MMPFARMERASSSSFASSISVRGWNRFGRSRSLSISRLRSAGAAAAFESFSGMRADSPRPSAGRFSTMLWLRGGRQRSAVSGEHLACESKICLGAARFHVVHDRGQAVAGRFAEPNVSWNDDVVDALLEERTNVARDLLPQVRSLVIHRHQYAGDVELRIERATDAAKR